MSENNKAIVRRSFEELFNQGKLDAVQDIVARDYVGHDPAMPQDIRGADGFQQFVRMYRTAFPDLQMTIEDQFAEGDCVVTRWKGSGTHRGELFGIPPTGNRGTITGIAIDRLANGKIAEAWLNYDALGLMRQLGVLAAQPQAARGAEQPARRT